MDLHLKPQMIFTKMHYATLESFLDNKHPSVMRIFLCLAFLITSIVAPAQTKTWNLFQGMLRSYYEDFLKLNPSTASSLGDYRYNDQLENSLSQPYRDDSRKLFTRYLDSLKKFDQ